MKSMLIYYLRGERAVCLIYYLRGVSVAVDPETKHPDKGNGGRKVYLSSQLRVTVRHHGDAKVLRAWSNWLHHRAEKTGSCSTLLCSPGLKPRE